MNKKMRLFPLMIVLLLSISCVAPAAATNTRASDYLAGYGISMEAIGNGRMEIFYDVDGVSKMSKIGAQALYVDYYSNGYWYPYVTLLGADNPDFYDYNMFGHSGFAYFDGVPGVKYRVTLKAYASDSTGSDTGSVTSATITCR